MIICTRFNEYKKGSLLGFATLFIDKWGIEINSCTLHEKDGKSWVNLPTREYEEEGQKKFMPIIFFKDSSLKTKFIEQAKDAIENFRTLKK